MFFQVTGAKDPLSTFSITTSSLNQKIEAYWSKVRQDRPGWWKSFFSGYDRPSIVLWILFEKN